MSVEQFKFVEWTSGTYSPWLPLPGGPVLLHITAQNYAGCTIGIQSSPEASDATAGNEVDPNAETPGTLLARTANGPGLSVEGCTFVRLVKNGAGAPSRLRLGYRAS